MQAYLFRTRSIKPSNNNTCGQNMLNRSKICGTFLAICCGVVSTYLPHLQGNHTVKTPDTPDSQYSRPDSIPGIVWKKAKSGSCLPTTQRFLSMRRATSSSPYMAFHTLPIEYCNTETHNEKLCIIYCFQVTMVCMLEVVKLPAACAWLLL